MGEKKKYEFITKEHGENLPTIRIKKVILDGFKNVGHGEIVFNCGREFVPAGTEADILGIYGQNGSGKTAFIEALSILQRVMSGFAVPHIYADCVSIDKEFAKLEFVFDLQYKDGPIREAAYSFCMANKPLSKEEIKEKYKDAPEGFTVPYEEGRVVIFNETISLLWEEVSKRQPIIDTSPENTPFVPATKRKELVGSGNKAIIPLEVNKRIARENSRSFIFMDETLELFEKYNNNSVLFKVLVEMRYYARYFLYVVDTKSSGFIRLNFAVPIYTRYGRMMFDATRAEIIEENAIDSIREDLESISDVLEQLVPGLSIGLKELTPTLSTEGDPAVSTMLVAIRDGKELPLRDESDGVRKTISILSLIIDAYNEKSFTVAIDEFDAGVFEYLLGEILQVMEASGRGQFIFTSHNLRPLEVINKKYLYFTTTNPDKRYIRLKNISATNNLRDTYFREILISEQDEDLYNKTKRYRIMSALKKAGEKNGEKA